MKTTHFFISFVLLSLVLAPAYAGVENQSPKISLEQMVCDLGQVGLGTKNACEFRFTNPGQALLKITNVKRTLSVS